MLSEVDMRTLEANAQAILAEEYATTAGLVGTIRQGSFWAISTLRLEHRIGRCAKAGRTEDRPLCLPGLTLRVLLNGLPAGWGLCVLRTTGNWDCAILARVCLTPLPQPGLGMTESAADLLFEAAAQSRGGKGRSQRRAAKEARTTFLSEGLGLLW